MGYLPSQRGYTRGDTIMKTKIIVGILTLLMIAAIAFANEESFEQAEQLIQQKGTCSELRDEQLELIGDYYMEQMHPDQQHEFMDEIMGGEGSAQLRQVHINIARMFYCGDRTAMSAGMMNMMMGRGMMNYGGIQNQGGLREMMGFGSGYGAGYGMMGSYGFWNVFTLLYVVLIIGLIILVYLWIIKLWKNQRRGGK